MDAAKENCSKKKKDFKCLEIIHGEAGMFCLTLLCYIEKGISTRMHSL